MALPAGGDPAVRPASARRAKPHVCFVAPHAWPVFAGDRRLPVVGGAEVQQCVLARLFARHGLLVSMITLDYGQPDRVVVDGVQVHKAFAPAAGVPVLRFMHPRLTAMWRALDAAGADVYYFRSAAMWLAVITAYCRRRGRRAVYAGASDRDFEPDIGGQVRYARDRWLYRRGLAQVDRIVVQNAAQAASCRTHYRRDSVLIPSTYELPSGRGPAPGELVLWVGMVHANKRPELLLEVAKRLPHRRFALIGGPRAGADAYYQEVRARASALPNVEMTGFLPLAEAEAWFDRARVLVNTSEYEGMPNTFLQAWARGVPAVATVDVGAPVQLVAADADGLAQAVERAFREPELGRRSLEYFRRVHSPAAALERYDRLFAELAA